MTARLDRRERHERVDDDILEFHYHEIPPVDPALLAGPSSFDIH